MTPKERELLVLVGRCAGRVPPISICARAAKLAGEIEAEEGAPMVPYADWKQAQERIAGLEEILENFVRWSEVFGSFSQSQWADDNNISQECHWINVTRIEACAALSKSKEVTLIGAGNGISVTTAAGPLDDSAADNKPDWEDELPNPDADLQAAYNQIADLKRQLAAANDALAERKKDMAIMQDGIAALLDSAQKAEAALAEARKDTERLDWLQRQLITELTPNGKLDSLRWQILSHDQSNVRAAIDSARAREKA